MADKLSFLDKNGIRYLWSQLSLEDYPNNEVLVAIINAIDEAKADKTEVPEIIKKYFLVVETVRNGANYLLDGVTFSELYDKFQLGNVNMVCHVDGTDYIPLLSVTPSKIIFSGIYNTTSVSLDFNSDGVGTLSTTYICDRSSLTTHTSNKDIHITAEERELWNGANAYTDTAIANLVNSAPETLDTIGELAAAFEDNKEVVDVLNEAITTKYSATNPPPYPVTSVDGKTGDITLNSEVWTFTLSDGSVITKEVVVK